MKKLACLLHNPTQEVPHEFWQVGKHYLIRTVTMVDVGTLVAVTPQEIILRDAPVTFLLFIEKQLGDLATMVRKLPVLDQGETWKHEAATNAYATDPSMSVKTKKIPRAFVKAPATVQHPAQVDTFTEDVVVGQWKTIKYSGAMPQSRAAEVLERIGKLQAAVKFAREEANTITVTDRHVGKDVFAYLLA